MPAAALCAVSVTRQGEIQFDGDVLDVEDDKLKNRMTAMSTSW